MTLIALNAVCNCFICFFEVLCSWLMTLICRFRPSLATAQTNRFALRLARDSVQRGHTVPVVAVYAYKTLVVLRLVALLSTEQLDWCRPNLNSALAGATTRRPNENR